MIQVSEIAKKLAERAETVCLSLLPGGTRKNGHYVCANLNGGEGESLKVNLEGEHAGKWKDWAEPDYHGDLLDLWRLSRNIAPGEAIQQAKAFLGIKEPNKVAKKAYAKAPERPYKEPNPVGKAMSWLVGERRLNPEVIARYKVQVKNDEAGRALVFPSYSPTGELINRSYRTLPVNGEKKKVWQDGGCAPSLFGWQALPKEALQMKEVILCEGQIDCMTWAQWGMSALSIPNGSGMTWIDYEWDNLQAFERIYLSFDMDERGREFTKEAARRLGLDRCNIVEIPRKDANQCLQDGFTQQDAAKWLAASKAPDMTDLIIASDLGNRISAGLSQKEKPFSLKIFDQDYSMKKGLFFQPGHVTTWTGYPSAGKSTLLQWVVLCAVCKEIPVFIGSFEVLAEDTVKRMVCASLASDGEQRSEQNILDWIKFFGHRIVLADVVGSITRDKLFEMMRFSYHRHGCKQFVIDSLMRISGLEEDYPAQGQFLNDLQHFAKTTGAHVHLVAHPGKPKEMSKRAGMMDVKGSSLIANNTDNLVVVSRNKEKSDILKDSDGEPPDEVHKMHDTEVTVEKQRWSGWVGTFYLKFNPHDLTFESCQKYSPPKPDKRSWQKNNKSYHQY